MVARSAGETGNGVVPKNGVEDLSKKKRVLLIGGSGRVGRYLVNRLVQDRSIELRVGVRDVDQARAILKDMKVNESSVDFRQVDIKDEA